MTRTASMLDAESLVESSADAILAVGTGGEIRSWNRGAARMFGYTADEALGQPLAELVHPADAAAEFLRWLNVAIEGGQAVYETVAVRRDGIPLSVDGTISAAGVGPAGVFVVTMKDVTELKYRRAARRIDERYGALLEAAPDAIIIVDRSGRIAGLNRHCQRLFGYERSDLLGKPIEVLVPERLRAAHKHHRAHYHASPRARAMGSGLELFARRRNGTEVAVEISLSPLDTEEGKLVVAAIRDITDRRIQYQRLQEVSRLKSEFVANMSHELRTPLNSILGFAGMLHDGKLGPLNDRQREFLADMLTSARHLHGLIDDVLDLSKIEAGKMELRPEPVRVSSVIGEARDVVRALADQKRIRIRVDVVPEADEVVVDPGKLKQIVFNYLSNAIKFSNADSEVRVSVRPEGELEFRIEVSDDGVGIREEDIPRLFAEFEQLDTGTGKRAAGTGLGLAISRGLTELLGGHVGVRSELGKGSTFFAVLPRDAGTS